MGPVALHATAGPKWRVAAAGTGSVASSAVADGQLIGGVWRAEGTVRRKIASGPDRLSPDDQRAVQRPAAVRAGSVLDDLCPVPPVLRTLTRVGIRVLGPVGVVTGDGPVVLRSEKLRCLLALLVAAGPHVLSVDRVVEELWHGRAPKTAHNNVLVLVYRLRKLLGADAVVREGAGYRLALDSDTVDAWRFEALATKGLRARDEGDLETASARFGEALECWNGGTPFSNVDLGPTTGRERERLEELRLWVVEANLEVCLERGEHAQRLPELQVLVAEYPRRESLRAALMLALYRCGRTAEAVESYRAGQDLLAEETGLEPGPQLQELHKRILDQDPELDLDPTRTDTAGEAAGAPQGTGAPAELPAPPAAFTGREDDLEELATRVSGGAVVGLYGMGGAGKSALALQLAHLVADRFPDGQLYLDLHGATPGIEAVRPEYAVARALRSLGEKPPNDPDEAAARYRTITVERRVLVVLDDASGAAQVRDLLPGSGGNSAVILTSRAMPATLDITVHHPVHGLPAADSIRLLGKLAGTAHLAADADTAAAIATACGHLPLALRIAGARLAAQPGRGLAWLAERLADQPDRLNELEHGDLAVRGCLAVGLESLHPDDARTFAHLGVLDIPTLHTSLVAALLDTTERRAERSLDRLAEAHLVQPVHENRYTLHDLVRLYAREHATELPAAEREAAFVRAVHWYVASARTASRTLTASRPEQLEVGLPDAALQSPGMDLADLGTPNGPSDPAGSPPFRVAAWLEAENDNLIALVEQAHHASGPTSLRALAPEFAALVVALFNPVVRSGRRRDYLRIGKLVTPVAAEAGLDDQSIGRLEQVIGASHGDADEFAEAERLVESALAHLRKAGHPESQANVLNRLAVLALSQGQYARARPFLDQGIAIVGDNPGSIAAGNLRANLAALAYRQGDLETARARFAANRDLARSISDRHLELRAVAGLATVHDAAGEPISALEHATIALALARRQHNDDMESYALWKLGDAHATLGDDQLARAYWRDAMTIYQASGHISPDRAREILAQDRPENPSRVL